MALRRPRGRLAFSGSRAGVVLLAALAVAAAAGVAVFARAAGDGPLTAGMLLATFRGSKHVTRTDKLEIAE